MLILTDFKLVFRFSQYLRRRNYAIRWNKGMKICWDNLEKLEFRDGFFYVKKNKGNIRWYVRGPCATCGEDYLTKYESMFCSYSCSNKSREPHIWSKESREKLSKSVSKEKNPNWENNYSNAARKKIGDTHRGKEISLSHIERIKKYWENRRKAGTSIGPNGASYDRNAPLLEWREEVRRSKVISTIIEVRCAYCGKWFQPTYCQVGCRIGAMDWDGCKFYCSDTCKKECPTFKRSKYPLGFKIDSSREVQPELRKLVFERDDWVCQICGSTKFLHCHHIEGIHHNPIESADLDICVTLCKLCHRKVHSETGCKTSDMACR
jgi:hypothetical protein